MSSDVSGFDSSAIWIISVLPGLYLMGNICGKQREESYRRPLIRLVLIRTDELFVIPELSPKMEYSIIKSSPKFG